MDPAPSGPLRLGRSPELDGLRGTAVLLVVGVHLSLLLHGYIGVDMFFVLSGFLITALLLEEHERSGRISLRGFFVRRARRLLPALAVLLVAFATLVLALDPYPSSWPLGRLMLSTATFGNNWVATLAAQHGHVLGPLVPTWTLAQEAQFYLLWALALSVLLAAGLRRWTLPAILVVGIAALLVGAQLARAGVAGYNGYTSPLDRGSELLIGCLAAVLWRERWVPRLLEARPAGPIACAGLAVVLFDHALSERLSYLCAALLTALLIVNLLAPRNRARPAVLARGLSARPLRAGGRVSYGIYLYHLPLYYLIWHYLPGHSHLFYLPFVLLGSIALATLSWRLVEAPVLRRRRFVRRAVRPALARAAASLSARERSPHPGRGNHAGAPRARQGAPPAIPRSGASTAR